MVCWIAASPESEIQTKFPDEWILIGGAHIESPIISRLLRIGEM
jgi:hypothetical protein